MANENGEWIMRGRSWEDPDRIRSWRELIKRVKEVGFLPLFAGGVEGFSAEEQVSPDFWWTGDREQDPWEWRELIAASREVAYGKFFGTKAGFISPEWLPYFANSRREGYDFDARWEDGRASRREKILMDFFLERDADGDAAFREEGILSTELKKRAGFGKGRGGSEGTAPLKNFQGIVTQLQMETYLVIAGFQRRENRRGEEYGMPVSVLLPPESIWGYEAVTSAYSEDPRKSWERLMEQIRRNYPGADEDEAVRLIGKEPGEP